MGLVVTPVASRLFQAISIPVHVLQWSFEAAHLFAERLDHLSVFG
nr:hypothetical protein [Mesorhizobium sp.]